jgi:N6-L-threonylcarbamoyladenine synthase
MGLPYPGGPYIEKLAESGDADLFQLKAGFVKGKPLDFSFSGLKTAVLYAYQKSNDQANLAAAFQKTAFKDVIKKTLMAAELKNSKTLVFGGGVTNNQTLRKEFAKHALGYQLLWPSANLSLDNAAMIAGLAYHKYLKNGKDSLDLDAITSISF